jgi:N-acyl-D-amino-acid deacylase
MCPLYDLLINGATIIDGSGAPAYTGSLAVAGERIAAVGPNVAGEAARVIEGAGRVVAPGFVDPHTHADRAILEFPLVENLVMQGVTTIVGGNCGFAMAPVNDPAATKGWMARRGVDLPITWKGFGEWLSLVETEGVSPNFAALAGHNTIRMAAMGTDFRRPATAAEVEQMVAYTDEAMRAGAVGLSAGLDAHWPGHFATNEELVSLVKVAQSYGGYFTPHTKHHQNQWPAAGPKEYGYGVFHAPTGEIIAGRYHGLLEAVEIARDANNARLHIAHLTPAYIIPQPHPAYVDDILAKATLEEIVDRAVDAGLDVTFNALGWSQSIGAEEFIRSSFFNPRSPLPAWLTGLGKEEFARRLARPSFRERVKKVIYSGAFKFGMLHPLTDPYWADCWVVVRCKREEFQGRIVGDIARERSPGSVVRAVYDETLEVLFDMLAADPDTTWALVIDKREHGALHIFFQHPAGMPCTDVSAFPAETPDDSQSYMQPGRGVPPIAYGMFPHYLCEMVKERGVMSLEQAIRQITYTPCHDLLKLDDRGILKEGAYADVVMFDWERLHAHNDFLRPALRPDGIEQVLVNGTVVYDGVAHTGARAGKVLRRA